MKKAFGPLVALTILVGATSRLGAEDKSPETPYYPVKVGSSWTYKLSSSDQRLTTRVAKFEKVVNFPCAVMETNAGGTTTTEYVTVKPDGVYRVKGGRGEIVVPPFPFLKLPPKKGDTWTIDSKAEKFTINGKGTVDDDAAEVKVPAGTYKAVVVTLDLQVGSQKILITSYFASGVGLVKQTGKIQGIETTTELEKYEEGK